MEKVHLEVVTPEKIVVSEKVDTVVAPGVLGTFGVLPSHARLLTGIVPGEVRWKTGSRQMSLAVGSGFAEVSDDRVSILVDTAEPPEEIDLDRAGNAMERAKRRLFGGTDEESIDFARAQAALDRAVARINVARKRS